MVGWILRRISIGQSEGAFHLWKSWLDLADFRIQFLGMGIRGLCSLELNGFQFQIWVMGVMQGDPMLVHLAYWGTETADAESKLLIIRRVTSRYDV